MRYRTDFVDNKLTQHSFFFLLVLHVRTRNNHTTPHDLSYNDNSTIIASLASVEGLIDVWPKLADLFVKAPWLEAVLAQLAPLLIIVSNEVLKIILVVLSGLEGPGECSIFIILITVYVVLSKK